MQTSLEVGVSLVTWLGKIRSHPADCTNVFTPTRNNLKSYQVSIIGERKG